MDLLVPLLVVTQVCAVDLLVPRVCGHTGVCSGPSCFTCLWSHRCLLWTLLFHVFVVTQVCAVDLLVPLLLVTQVCALDLLVSRVCGHTGVCCGPSCFTCLWSHRCVLWTFLFNCWLSHRCVLWTFLFHVFVVTQVCALDLLVSRVCGHTSVCCGPSCSTVCGHTGVCCGPSCSTCLWSHRCVLWTFLIHVFVVTQVCAVDLLVPLFVVTQVCAVDLLVPRVCGHTGVCCVPSCPLLVVTQVCAVDLLVSRVCDHTGVCCGPSCFTCLWSHRCVLWTFLFHVFVVTQVCAVDLLVPRVGELVGGSLREDDTDLLLARLTESHLHHQLQWSVCLYGQCVCGHLV